MCMKAPIAMFCIHTISVQRIGFSRKDGCENVI